MSGPCRIVTQVASNLGLEVTPVVVDLWAGEQKKEDYLKLNPHGKVPTLTDGDITIYESVSIARYLCEKKGDTPLYPADFKQRAKVDEALGTINDFRTAGGMISFNRVLAKIRNVPAAPE